MPLFKSDIPLIWVLVGNPLINAVLGFLFGYFFVSSFAFSMAGIIVFLLVIAFFDTQGRELDVLFVWKAMFSLVIFLIVLLLTTISVNELWANILPSGILRQ